MASPYETLAFTGVIAAFGYLFPKLLFVLHIPDWLVPVFTIVGMNLMAYWLLIPSFKYRKKCSGCGAVNKLTANKCMECKRSFPPETSPYEVVSFAALIFVFGYFFSQLLTIYISGIILVAVTVPALLLMGAWLLLPNFRHRRICGECGAVNWRESRKCMHCGEKFD